VGAVDVPGEQFDSTGVLLGCSPERIRIVQLLVWTTTWQDTRPRCYVNGVQVVYEYDGGLLSNKHKHGPGKDEGPGAGKEPELHVVKFLPEEKLTFISGTLGEYGVCCLTFGVELRDRRHTVTIGHELDGHEATSKHAKGLATFETSPKKDQMTPRSPKVDGVIDAVVGLHGVVGGFLMCIGLITSEDRSQLERDFSAKEKKEAHLTPRSRMEGARPVYIPHAPTAPPVPNLEQTVCLYVFSNFVISFA
jgi:hypothetical protein